MLLKNWPDLRSVSNFVKFVLPDPRPKYLVETSDHPERPSSECLILPISARNIEDSMFQSTAQNSVNEFDFANDLRRYGHTLFVALMRPEQDTSRSEDHEMQTTDDKSVETVFKLYEWLAHNQQLPTATSNDPKQKEISQRQNRFKNFNLIDKRSQPGRYFLLNPNISLNRHQTPVKDGKILLPHNNFSKYPRVDFTERHIDEIRDRNRRVSEAKSSLSRLLDRKSSRYRDLGLSGISVDHSRVLSDHANQQAGRVSNDQNQTAAESDSASDSNSKSLENHKIDTLSDVVMELDNRERHDNLSPFSPNSYVPEGLVADFQGPTLAQRARLVGDGLIDSSPFNSSPQDNLKFVLDDRGKVTLKNVEFLTDEDDEYDE